MTETHAAATATPEPPVGAGEESSVAVVRYNAMAPIGSKRNLQGLLERQMGALQKVLPKHVTPERLVKTLLVAINRQPQLLECTQESVLESVARAAELGLDLSGTLGEAYLVPFNNKIKIGNREEWRMQATFIPGYRGLAKLARQSGEIKRIEANVVYERDTFDFEQGTEFRLRYKRSLESDRGKKLGVYALVEFKDGGVQAEWMTVAEIERIRQQAKSKDSPAWKHHWDEMGKKTCFRRLSKWLPLSGEKWNAALVADNADYDFDGLDEAVIDLGEETKSERLARELAEQEAPAGDVSAEGEPVAGDPDAAVRTVLAPDEIQELQKLAKSAKVDWTHVEELFGGPIETLESEGKAAAELYRDVEQAIRDESGAKGKSKG